MPDEAARADAPKVMVVEGQPILRQALTALLRAAGYEASEAGNAESALDLVGSLNPDLVVMDAWLPGMSGIEATSRLRLRHPGVRVLILSADDRPGTVRAAVAAGANGYLTKVVTPEGLLDAVRRTAEGQAVLMPADLIQVLVRTAPGQPPAEQLSRREREVLNLVARGYTAGQIGTRLGLSRRTVENHVARIRTKLGVGNKAQLALAALRHLDAPPDDGPRHG